MNKGNFYTDGEYSRIINDYGIHGVSFNQKVDSVKHWLDPITIDILKVLLQEHDAPCSLDLKTTLTVIATLEFIQSQLSNDNENVQVFNNSLVKGEDAL